MRERIDKEYAELKALLFSIVTMRTITAKHAARLNNINKNANSQEDNIARATLEAAIIGEARTILHLIGKVFDNPYCSQKLGEAMQFYSQQSAKNMDAVAQSYFRGHPVPLYHDPNLAWGEVSKLLTYSLYEPELPKYPQF